MSAAQTEIDPIRELILEEEFEVKRGRPSKDRRNTSRRNVVNLPDELAFFIGENLELFGAENVPQALRVLAMEGLRSRGVTVQQVRVVWRKEALRRAKEDLEAMEAEMSEEASEGEE